MDSDLDDKHLSHVLKTKSGVWGLENSPLALKWAKWLSVVLIRYMGRPIDRLVLDYDS